MSTSSNTDNNDAVLTMRRLISKRVFELRFRRDTFGQTSLSIGPGVNTKSDSDTYSLHLTICNLKNGGYGIKLSLPIEFNIRDEDLV